MKTNSVRGYFALLMIALALAGCDHGPLYSNPYCRVSGEQNDLFCEMGRQVPWTRSGNHMQFVDLCQQVDDSSGILLVRLFQNVHQENKFLAIGGRCAVESVLEQIVVAANLDEVRFDGLLVHLFVDEQSNPEAEIFELRQLGAIVKRFQLDSRHEDLAHVE